MISILMSILVPLISAPFATYSILKLLINIHNNEKELIKSNLELDKALKSVKELSGMLPICASCKKIRDDNGYWNQVEEYISKKTDAMFSHGLCPDCFEKESKKIDEYVKKRDLEKIEIKIK